MQLKDGNSENPSVYNDEAPSNPSSQYTINLDFLAGEKENEWYKVKGNNLLN